MFRDLSGRELLGGVFHLQTLLAWRLLLLILHKLVLLNVVFDNIGNILIILFIAIDAFICL